MEKKITLTMQPSKDIDVSINGYDGMAIGKESRTLKADDIYNLLSYERGDKYTVDSVNEQNLDAPVLKFFTELFTEITSRLNKLSASRADDDEDEEESSGNYSSSSCTGMDVEDDDLPF